uniref:[histone H3]-trimethyl-L-lysine(4) demethylase n=1 Tax=Gadus morhua TaxID=8049 RepID=A0A8C5A3W1_GADMO
MSRPRTDEFKPPPECPVFEPSWEEFGDPFAFINKIRPIAEKTGICKVRPPPGWQPPFACDVDRLHFVPRIQRLNELELVADEGGFDLVCRDRRWTKIALQMGFAPGKAIGSHLRAHYEKVLYPYNLFQSGANLLYMLKPTLAADSQASKDLMAHDAPPRDPQQPERGCPNAYGAKHLKSEVGLPPQSNTASCQTKTSHSASGRVHPVQVDLVVCLVCGSGADEDRLLLCDGCDDSYHTFCLIPSLQDVPKGDWRCPKCLAQECSKPQEAFGFEQAYRDYSLRAFGQMADAFKSDYFNMPVHMVPTELVEKEFWRLVGAIEEDVTVEYGADIASKEFGSGFPIPNGRFKVSPADEKYLKCGWNLNNMAMMDPSVLTHVTADICGMTLPWLYVGMCFSSFCWHIEDHWSYSINYLHWGEPKTWYGAPGSAAEQLEAVMKKLAPELFDSQPDLLHQLVTIMNPNTLMAHGVPIYRTNQCAGEFVVTFPRAYHSGFNQGFNFAEAVNFCTTDWMPLGRQCVDHYRLLNRYNVFSHDEMVCNMASKAGTLDVVLASAVHRDMALMIREEKALRDAVKKLGVSRCQEAKYDHLQDDERQCVKCRTTCYLSAVTCPCSPGVLACLHHIHDLCPCPVSNYTLNYRFTLDDLYPMMTAVKHRAELYDDWASRVAETLDARLEKKKGLSVFRSLVSESDSNIFPDNDLLFRLQLVTKDAEKCSSVAQQLLGGKRQTRFRCGGKSQSLLTVEELRSFVRQLYNLPCSLTQAPLLKKLLNDIEDFQQHSEKVLSEAVSSVVEIQGLLDVSFDFDVELPELPCLRVKLEHARWLEGVQQATGRPSTLTLEAMRRLIDQGLGLAPHPSVEKAMARLQELLSVAEHWEDKAGSLLRASPPHPIETLSAAAEKASAIPAQLPNCLLLKASIRTAREWLQEAEEQQAGGTVPTADALADMVLRGQAIQVHLEPLERFRSLSAEVQEWKESAASMLLKKDSPFTLLEILCPRFEVGSVGSPKRKPKKASQQPGKKKTVPLDSLADIEKALSESKDSSSAAATLEELRLREMDALAALRAHNESKLLPSGDCMELTVCLCHKTPMGAMLQCELCRDAFHSVCVRDPGGSPAERPWLCPPCRRSEAPPMAEVLSLLAALERTRVRLPEADALHFLVERAVSWQHRARQTSDELRLQEMQEGPGTPPVLTRWASGSTTADSNAQVCGGRAPYLTPEWNKTSLPQTVFYTEQKCIPLQGLSRELEELMVEGLLLPVSLPETQDLYHVLLQRPLSPPPAGCLSPPLDDSSDCTEHLQLSSQEKTLSWRHLAREGVKAEGRPGKDKKPHYKRQKMNKDKSLERRAASTSSSPRSDFSQSDDSDEEMSECPAESCQQPEGDEVDWVQCDGRCNQWFHQVCVGVTTELAEKEDYVCVGCTIDDGHLRQ